MSQTVTQNSFLSQNWVKCTVCTHWTLVGLTLRLGRAHNTLSQAWPSRVARVYRPYYGPLSAVSLGARERCSSVSQLPSVTIQNCIATQALASHALRVVSRALPRVSQPPTPYRGALLHRIAALESCITTQSRPSATIQCFVSRLPLARPCARCCTPCAQAGSVVGCIVALPRRVVAES